MPPPPPPLCQTGGSSTHSSRLDYEQQIPTRSLVRPSKWGERQVWSRPWWPTPNTGGSTLHTVDFGGGKAEAIHLAKRPGGKGAKFHIAGEGEGASGGGISYHAAATPERNQSRLAHRAGQSGAE